MAAAEKSLVDTTDDTAIKGIWTCPACGATKCKDKCAKCMVVFYCSKDCQKAHWKQHKKVCTQFMEVIDALKEHDMRGVGLPGSWALHWRLKIQENIESTLTCGYVKEPSGTCFLHTWLEVDNRVYDCASHVLGYSRKKVKYYKEQPKGVPRQDMATPMDRARSAELIDGIRKLVNDEDNFRKTWLMNMWMMMGTAVMHQLFTTEVMEKLMGTKLFGF